MPGSSFAADAVIRRANIITIDPKRPRAQAVAIKDGKFIAIGDDHAVSDLIGPSTEVFDLSGKTVLPGFIDAHIHVLSSGTRHVMAADCDRRSISAVQDALRERARGASRGQWVEGFKFDDTKTVESRFLNREDLDRVSTELPIIVSHRAGHVYYLNSMALEAAKFSSDTPDPCGGLLGRDPTTGELDGVIYERAIETMRPLLPPVTPESRREGLKLICNMLTQAGLTSVHDARVSNDELRTYQEGKESGDLSIRVYMLVAANHFPALRDAGLKTGFGDPQLRVGGIKMVSDGAIATRTAYLS